MITHFQWRASRDAGGLLFLLALAFALFVGCDRPSQDHGHAHAQPHHHAAPRGGTVVTLGNEEYHLELVRDRDAGQLTAYLLDGHLDHHIRIKASAFALEARLPDGAETLEFRAQTNRATGETVGDTATFVAEADWLRTTPAFEATLVELEVRGRTYRSIHFRFPEGHH
jgi:hypothetical protein